MSFDFEMTADGSKAVKEADKVETALAEVERKARETGKTITDAFTGATKPVVEFTEVFGSVPPGMQKTKEEGAGIEEALKLIGVEADKTTKKLSLNTWEAISEGFSKSSFGAEEFGKRLNEVAKAGGAMAIAQGIQLASEKVKELTGIPVGGPGTMIGFMFGGPLGAAVGTLAEMAITGESLHDWADNMAGPVGELGDRIDKLTKGAETQATTFDRLAKGARSTADAVQLLTGYLDQLYTATATFSSLHGALDLVTKDLDTQKGIIDKVLGPSATYTREIANLTKLLENGKLTHAEYALQLGEVNSRFLAGDLALKAVTEQHKAALDAAQKHAAFLAANKDVWALIAGVGGPRFGTQGSNSQAWAEEKARRDWDVDVAMKMDAIERSMRPDGPDLASDLAAWERHTQKLVENTKKWRDELNGASEMNDVIAGQISGAASSLGSTVVSAANGADVAWKSTLSSILEGIEKAIVQAMILNALTGSPTGAKGAGVGGGYGGLFGVLFGGARSTGGTYTAPGYGGGDSVPVLFRMSPGETATFSGTRPSSASAGAGGGAGESGRAVQPTVTVINQGDDGRDLLSHLDSPTGHRAIANVIRRRRTLVRSVLG